VARESARLRRKASVNLEKSCEFLSREQCFALRVKSRYEKVVAAMAHSKGYEEFLPLSCCRRRWTDRFKSVEVPLFPGYVFCRLDVERRLPLLIIPGVMHFVGLGRVPVPIDEAEIAMLQSAVRSGLGTEPWPFLDVGQRVRLAEGPLTGLEGILVEVRKQHRLIVSVTLLQRSVAVEIEREWVRPLDANGRKTALLARPSLVAASVSL
jgi:transcription antitermination factor NusG